MPAAKNKKALSQTNASRNTGKASGRPSKPVAEAKKAPAGRSLAARTFKREVWGFILMFLALFALLGLFGIKAVFINFFRDAAGALTGLGYYILPFALITAGMILITHGGRPVKARVTCGLLFIPLGGAIMHLFSYETGSYNSFWELVKLLWNDGLTLNGGGVVGGLFALGLEIAFSKIGAALLLIGLAIFMTIVCFSISPRAIYRYFADSLKREPLPEEPQPVSEPEPTPPLPKNDRRNIRRAIDIPVDDPIPVSDPIPVTEPESAAKPASFFKTREIKTPDELIAAMAAGKSTVSADFAAAPDAEAPVQAPVIPQSRRPLDRNEPKEDIGSAAANIQSDAGFTVTVAEPKSDPASDIKGIIEEAAHHATVAGGYNYPPTSLLDFGTAPSSDKISEELHLNAQRLSETIKSFGVEARLINVARGPSVTRYELEMDMGIKLARLTSLADDIALSLGASGVRIAPIPDKISVVGIEVPNKLVSTVYLRTVLESREFKSGRSKLSFALGVDISGECIVGDISKFPHMLIAGTTGSGKSVCMNSLIVSLLYKASPEDVRLIMIDPKMIELNVYNGIPHLLIPVVTDPKKASGALQWAVNEMMHRYKLFAEQNVRDIAGYNEVIKASGEGQTLPQIVIVIDELADLMLVAAKEVEESVCRIAQMARAAGMHLIIATQRPSADVITGIMKANIPSRIAFAVSSQLESRIILDITGAEKLVGKGDMLFFPLGAGKPIRVQGCLISSSEVNKVVDYIKKNAVAAYESEIIEQIERNAAGGGGGGSDSSDDKLDDAFCSAVEVILDTQQASASNLQRKLTVGYARAARIIDQLEARGIVGPFEGAKPRKILITRAEWEEMKLQNPQYQ